MSTHYTPAPRQFQAHRLARFIGYIGIPLLFIAGIANAWADGSRQLQIGFTAGFNDYITLLIAYRINKKHPFQVWFLILGIEVLGFAIAQGYLYTVSDAVQVLVWTTGFLLLMASFQIRHHNQLKQLLLPIAGTGNRSADFPGIYRITCLPNGKQYIGQTAQANNARWAEHRAHLHSRRHHNRWLQADWDLYRPEQFKWEVLEVVTDSVWLLDRERVWQDTEYDANKRYNPPNLPPRIAKASRRPVMKRKTRS